MVVEKQIRIETQRTVVSFQPFAALSLLLLWLLLLRLLLLLLRERAATVAHPKSKGQQQECAIPPLDSTNTFHCAIYTLNFHFSYSKRTEKRSQPH